MRSPPRAVVASLVLASLAIVGRPARSAAEPVRIDGTRSDFAVEPRDVRILEAPLHSDGAAFFDRPLARFAPLGRGGFDLGYPTGAIHLAFDVHNPTANEMQTFLVIASPFIDDVRVTQRSHGALRVDRAGDQIPCSAFSLGSTFPAFEIVLPPRSTSRLLVSLRSESQLRVPLRFLDLDSLVAMQSRASLGMGSLLAVLLILAVFNVYLLVIARETGFAWLVVHLVSTAIYGLAMSGIGHAYLWPNAVGATNLIAVSGGSLSAASMLSFLRFALGTRALFPRVDVALRAFAVAAIVMFVVAVFDFRSASHFGFMVFGLAPWVAVPAAVKRTQSQHGSTRFVTAAVILLAFSNAAYALTMAFVRGIDHETSMRISLMPFFAAAIAGVFFSLGVLERMRFIDAERTLLRASEARLARMAERASDVLFDVPRWVAQSLTDLHEALSGVHLSVYELSESGELSQLPAQEGELPSLAALLATEMHDHDETTDVRVLRGSDGGVLGAVRGVKPVRDGSMKKSGLLEGFLHQLEIALELRRSHVRLRTAESRSGELKAALEREGASAARLCTHCKRLAAAPMERCSDCGHVLRELDGVPIVIRGRYTLCRELGAGGMGHVFEARDSKLDSSVALKLVRPEHLSDPEFRERFELEGRALSRITHENVVRVLDAGSAEGGGLYLAMEFLEGKSLARCVRHGGRGRPRDVARFVRQAASALAAVHASGIVHRDVKPENFHLVPSSEGFVVKLLDFGVVRRLSENSGLTATGIRVGTPRYMSPEQLATGMASMASDVYALALVVGECIVGRPLVRDPSLPLVDRMRLGEPDELAYVTSSQHVARLLADALAATPERRPTDIVAWAEALAIALDAQEDVGTGWVIDGSIPSGSAFLRRSVAPTMPTMRAPDMSGLDDGEEDTEV